MGTLRWAALDLTINKVEDGGSRIDERNSILDSRSSILDSRSFPPGPKGHWLFGNLAEFRRDMLGFYGRCSRDYGDMVSFRLGHKRHVLVSHPRLIEEVLVTQNQKFGKHYALQFLRPVLGNGLLTSEGKFWLRQRRRMQPSFHRQRIEGYAPIVVTHAQRMLNQWRDGQVRDIHQDMMRLALAVAAGALLNVDLDRDCQEVGGLLDLIMKDFSYRHESAFPVPFWLPTPWNRRVKKAIRRLEDIIGGIIQQRRENDTEKGDLLSTLIQARDEENLDGMSDRQLRDEVMTLFLAGHETTANALAWTWYLLAQHPEAEDKMVAEIEAVLQGRLPTAADLPKLRFTESVFLESMRLFPPAYAFGREVLQECLLGGYRLPAGTTVLMSQWVMHRDGRYFDQADQFVPERWLTGLAQRLPKFVYIPFGGGPRGCIGNTFAMMEGVLVLAALAPHVHFRLMPDLPVEPWPSVTLRPKHGIRATLHRREGGRETRVPV
jgi:cytochrome P450